MISVLMSMRNATPYLDQAVRSILTQTFTAFEFVIVDNASTDGGADFVAAIEDPRIRLLRNSQDLGQSGALNRGLLECRGEWVARMDADDVALPRRLESQLRFLAAHPEAKATSCLAYHIDHSGRRVGKTIPVRPTPENDAVGYLHSGAVIDRELLLALGGYRPQFGQANDIDLWCRISDRHIMLEQHEYLMEYRVHPGTLSEQSYETGRLRHLWARDCMRARRKGAAEPTWEQFLEGRRNAPLWLRSNRWRKMRAKRCYRQAAQHLLGGRKVSGSVAIIQAAILQPEYTLPRLFAQVFSRPSRTGPDARPAPPVSEQRACPATVKKLFEQLEAGRIPYAVLRNYERLPDLRTDRGVNTDLDLVVASEAIPRFRELAAQLAREQGWERVTECDHFTQSPVAEHHIEVFRFYRFDPLEFIEVDLFHSYNLLALPLMDERDLLAGRIYDAELGLTRVDPFKENIYRLRQIARGHNEKKNQRYIERVLAQPPEFENAVRRYLAWPGVRALQALRAGQMSRFRACMRAAALLFLLRSMIRSPLHVARILLARCRENRLRYRRQPCGFVLPVHADSQGRQKLAEAARTLKTLNVLDDCVTYFDRDVLEQGGIVVEWTKPSEARISIQPADNPASIATRIGRLLAARHKVLSV